MVKNYCDTLDVIAPMLYSVWSYVNYNSILECDAIIAYRRLTIDQDNEIMRSYVK